MIMFLTSALDDADSSKIKRLYIQFHDEMIRLAQKKFESYGSFNVEADAEDAVQCLFWRVTKWIHKINFNRSEADIRNYLISILYNEIHTILSKSRGKIIYSENIEEFSGAGAHNLIEELDIKHNYERVVEEISRMNELYSITLNCVYVEDMSIKEVAKMMGISEKAVYSRLERGKEILRKNLKGEFYG